MVNLVIVSHSQRLAEGVKELAGQMIFGNAPKNTVDRTHVPLDQEFTHHDHRNLLHRGLSFEHPMQDNQLVQIAVASAGDLDSGCFGTNATSIVDAIREVWIEDGVLILVDLGSAVLNADLALELLPEEVSNKCLISNAPLVEGAVAAALEASLGRSLVEVNRVAEDANRHRKI